MPDILARSMLLVPLGLTLILWVFFMPLQRRGVIVLGIVLMMVGMLAFGAMPFADANFWRINVIQ